MKRDRAAEQAHFCMEDRHVEMELSRGLCVGNVGSTYTCLLTLSACFVEKWVHMPTLEAERAHALERPLC